MHLRTPIRPEMAVVCVAAYFLAALNAAFWRQFIGALAPQDAHEWVFVAAIAITFFGLLSLFFSVFAIPYLFKPVMTLFLLLTAAAVYFINEYGVVIDAEMIRNITHTDTGEAYDLLTGKLILYVVGLGLLPAIVLWVLPIAYRPFWQDLWFKTKATALVLPLIALVMLPLTGTAMSFFRENRMLLRVMTPLNYLSAIVTYGRGSIETGAVAAKPYGEDAHKAVVWPGRERRTLTVLVIGETARAQNFSLNGYGRETNPLLSRIPGLINYTQVHSCGTATAQSVPCMFSGRGRAGYRPGAGQEGLLHILQRAGISVLWRENQGGCAGVCKGVPTENAGGSNRKLFELGESLDENLLTGLAEKIDAMLGDAVIVLHMMGSHGPAYYKRYPEAFERFRPACKDSQFSRCQLSEIVNSYDNTIVYTDYVLAKLIELLAVQDRRGLPTAMIYVSDHGESLGENNVYLHGLPYAFAPDVQKHVPMVMWLSPKLQAESRVNASCLEHRRHEPVSHDNFFHSVLGLLGVQTTAYDPRLDVFASCRGASPMLIDD
jgi:lipid A ethanolaminephosphotransferase